jgi:iron complex outermembrane receptor protein
MKKTYLATAVAALFASPITTAIAADTLLDDVVVSSSRSEQRSFDAPGSIQSVNRSQIENGGPQINLSESLAAIPGINAANRNNYAQDLQVSIRGYGSRAPFGVRGVKMFQDGIPMTLADGQGQTSQFALTSADRIEVLKGPIASLYGNASGGVLQVFTRSPGDKPELTVADTIGSYGLNHKNIQYSEKRGDIGIVVDSSNFKSDGFRQWSAAEREHLNAKLEVDTDFGKATFIANYLDNKNTQDPGSLGLSDYKNRPNLVYTGGPNATSAYGKSFTQGIYGFVFDGKINSNTSYRYRLYTGDRQFVGAASDYSVIDRKFMGSAFDLISKTLIAGIPVKFMGGFEYDYVKDYRLAYTNTGGVMGATPTRNEDNLANNYGTYIQSEWTLSDKYTGLVGLRYTTVKLEVNDRYLNDSIDGSGSKKYDGLSPVFGLTYHLNEFTNIYGQIGSGFETPTLNEVLYINTGTGVNDYQNKFDLSVKSSRSNQAELGIKWRPSARVRADAAIFYAKTQNDIVPNITRVTGSTWGNATTERYGVEFSGQYITPNNILLRSALTAMAAKYDESTTSASDGNKMPGIPGAQLYFDIAWRSTDWLVKPKMTYSELGIDFRYTGKNYVDSRDSSLSGVRRNSITTDAYSLVGLRASHNYKNGAHTLTLFGRLDNLFDQKYVSSVVVNQASARYYEPGMPRNWILGVKYSLAMN